MINLPSIKRKFGSDVKAIIGGKVSLCRLIAAFMVFSTLFFAGCEALVVGSLSCHETLTPGESRRLKVLLTNDKDSEEVVELKLYDYACNDKGQHFYDPIGSQERSNASWVQIGTPRITLAPREKRDLYFTVEVPKQEGLKGSYWSTLMIEPTEPARKQTEEKTGFTLNVKFRYAYSIVTTVGKGTSKLKVLEKEFKTFDDKKRLSISVENQGDMFLNPKLVLNLYNAQGKLEKSINEKPERLYPAMSQNYLVNVDGVEAKQYTAFLMLDNGDNQIFADTFDIVFP